LTFYIKDKLTRLSQPQTHPNVSIIKGVDPARQWYLYEHIRQHCYSEEAKELTCPKPTIPKKEIDLTKQDKAKLIYNMQLHVTLNFYFKVKLFIIGKENIPFLGML
jgi:hypothetical protein